ncbi:DnaD domain protein [Dielma fastidiosa]
MVKDEQLKIERIESISDEERASLFVLYGPLIGSRALHLYSLLEALCTMNQNTCSTILLCQSLQLSPAELTSSRKILEQFMLIKTYAGADHMLIQLKVPKKGLDFLRHDVFGRLYLKQQGRQMYEMMQVSFAKGQIAEGYEEISEPFRMADWFEWEEEEEKKFHEVKPEKKNSMRITFNTELFLTQCSKLAFPAAARTKENIETIEQLGSYYGVNEEEMIKLVARSINLKTQTLSVSRLKNAITKKYQVVEADANPYRLPVIKFLQMKQNGVPVTNTDKRLLAYLEDELKLPKEVVNVLVEYVLNTLNQNLSKAYVEKIAGSWVRLNIDTMEKALDQVQKIKEPKPKRKPSAKLKTTEKQLPDWYTGNQQEEDEELKPEDIEKLKAELAKMRGE